MKKEVNTLHYILKQVMITNINANGLTGKLRRNINLKAKLNYQITSGSLTITENGTYDIAKYNEVVVDTIVPSGDIEITTNGTYDVAEYENAIVDCPSDLDWTALGYSERPSYIEEGYEYALEIKNNWNTKDTSFYINGEHKVTYFPTVDCSNIVNFGIKSNSTLLYVGYLNLSKYKGFSQFFYECRSLRKIEGIDTSNGTTGQQMFANCHSLKEIPEINTSKFTSANNMFFSCYSLTYVPTLDLSKCTNCYSMFESCRSLENAPILNNTTSVTSFVRFFASCTNLKNVPVYNMSSATGLTNMFMGCNNLTDESLYNIVESLLTATSYKGTKTLSTIFDSSGYNKYYARIQALSNYQDLVNAGWS